MAINWGAYSAHMRVGINVVQRPATVGQNTTSVALDLEVWVQMDGSSSQYINNGSIVFTGDWFGSATIPINLGPGQTARVWATTATVPTIVGQGQNKSYGATISHYHGVSYHGVIWWVAPRPAAPPPKPNTPTAIKVTRNSDTKHTIAWTRQSTYTSVVVQRRTNNGSWVNVGTASGNAASWVDTTTKANAKYEYRVAGKSAGGQSGWSGVSGAVFTTPAKTGAVTAARVGSNIRVSVAGLPTHATHFDIEDNGTVVGSAVPRSGLPWTHTNPALTATHRYRVRPRVASGGTSSATLIGAWSAYSATVQLTAPPNAPSSLRPNGMASEMGLLDLSWRHNPTDASEQTAFQVRVRGSGTTTWRELGERQSSSEVWATGTWELTQEPDLVEWQVRTKGLHASWSPWSATATLDVLDIPQVTVTAPESVVDHPTVTVAWEWFQGQGRPQSSWRVSVFTPDYEEIETISGTGATASVVLRNRYEDGQEYTGFVQLGTGGVWSEAAAFDFRVEFVPPLPADLSALWDEASGAAVVSVGETEAYRGDPISNYFTNPRLVGDGTYSEVNRNYQRNPGAVRTAAYSGSNAGSGSTVKVSNTWAGNPGILGTVTAYAGNWAYLMMSDSTAPDKTVPVTPGEWVAMQVLVHSSTGTVIGNIQFRSGQTFVAQGTTPITQVETSRSRIGTLIEFALQVPEGADRANFSFGFMTGHAGVQVGSWVAVSLPMIAKGATEAQARARARAQVNPRHSSGGPDMEAVWAGEPDNSESYLRIENVRGVVAHNAIAGVSTKGGKPAIRLISLATTIEARADFQLPAAARAGGVLAGTLIVEQSMPSGTSPRTLWMTTSTQPHPEVDKSRPGVHPLRETYDAGYTARFYHGGVVGSPDVWWTDIGIYPPGYTGEAFHGGSGSVDTGQGASGVQWDGEPDNSTSSTKPLPQITHTELLRSLDDGRTWEPFILDGAVSYIVNDWEARSNGRTMYRAITYSETGASTYVDVTLVADSQAMWLGGGEAFGVVARLPFDPSISIEVGRARSVQKYEGRSRGVAYASQHLDRVVNATMTVLENDSENATIEQIEAVAHADAALHLYRDPDGRRIYGAMSSISLSRETGTADGAIWSGSFQLEETDH